MSICIISDHNYAKTKFHYNTQHIDQELKPTLIPSTVNM